MKRSKQSQQSRNNFASALKVARKSLGLSQEDFSLVSSRTYVSTLERGIKSPTLNKIDDLSEALGIHPLALLALAYLGDTRPASVSTMLDQVAKELASMSDKKS